MSWQATAMAWSISGLEPSRRLVLLAVANYASENGKRIFPGIERLSHDTGLSESTVKRSLATLVEDGYLIQVKVGTGRGVASLYNMPIDFDCIRDFQKRGQTKSPSENIKEVIEEKKEVIDDKEGGHSELLTIQETLPRESTKIYTQEFEQFWLHYPFRVNGSTKSKNGKQAAFQHYKQARKKASQGELLAGLRQYIKATDPKYVIDAERWFKKAYWTIEVVDAPVAKADSGMKWL